MDVGAVTDHLARSRISASMPKGMHIRCSGPGGARTRKPSMLRSKSTPRIASHTLATAVALARGPQTPNIPVGPTSPFFTEPEPQQPRPLPNRTLD